MTRTPNEKNTLTPDELATLTRRTLRHYDSTAEEFWQGTRDHDVSQNHAAFLDALAAAHAVTRYTLLDFGCGPGRDLAHFAKLGHSAIGLDGAAHFVDMARTTGCEVWQQNFLALALPPAHFHGVFANASLFHVPRQELPRVLVELRDTLVPGGILFSSNPRGRDADEEGYHGDRYGSFHTLQTWRTLVTAAGFRELSHYYRPVGRPRAEQPWLATVWQRE